MKPTDLIHRVNSRNNAIRSSPRMSTTFPPWVCRASGFPLESGTSKIHGDGKSSAKGNWRFRTMITKPKKGEAPEYHVKIEEVVSKATVWINTYDDIPSFETVVEEVKAELGS